MNKERLAAFTDAVLAIIMTILVLELEKPKVVSVQGLWDLRENFMAYTISFFWIGLMWATQHSHWQRVTKISENTVYASLLMLFLSSFFPYTTSLVAQNFNNSTAQALYGIVILGVSFSNILISGTLKKVNPKTHFGWLYNLDNRSVFIDLLVKVVGLVLSITVFPPAMVWAIFLGMLVVGVDGVRETWKKRIHE
nr:TMEM175 family protein [Levilactobacillus humaensis]